MFELMAWGLKTDLFLKDQVFLGIKNSNKKSPRVIALQKSPPAGLLQVVDHTCGTPSCRPKASSEEHLSYKLACTTAGTGKHLTHIVTEGGDESLIVEEFAIGTPITIFCQSQL